MFDEGKFDVATIIYSRFKSVISQIPTATQLIPAPVEETPRQGGGHGLRIRAGRAGNPGRSACRATSACRFSRFLLENVAGEFGAKMTAMDGATRNAGEVIDKLTLLYNRTRQSQITKELIEIISGAEAL